MGTQNIEKRENEVNKIIFKTLLSLDGVKVLADNVQERLSIFSFYFEKHHFNLVVKLLNDKYGIQTRGGCSCAGTYGHLLLHVDMQTSKSIEQQILEGCDVEKPGWIRLSVHPTITDEEVTFICDSLKELSENIGEWANDYVYSASKNDYVHKKEQPIAKEMVKKWFAD